MKSKLKMRYTIDELDLKTDTLEEAKRTRVIFDEIKERQKKGKKIFELEKKFFCRGVKLSKDNDGNIEDYECCDNFRYTFLYLVYFADLTIKGKYYKPYKSRILRVPDNEVKDDLSFLKEKSEEWKTTVENTRISNELLKHLAKETRDEIKLLKKDIEDKSSEKYKKALFSLLLSSRYLYIMALEIFEMKTKDDMIFHLNSFSIEYNEYSLIHILKRHFSEVTKKYRNDKSYHNEMIRPKLMHLQLKNILKEIDSSGYYSNDKISKVTFNYMSIDYQLWINERTKSVLGVNTNYYRLETFYPLVNESDLKTLSTEYKYKKINKNLGVYVEKSC